MLVIAVLAVMVALTAACGNGSTAPPAPSPPAFTVNEALALTKQQVAAKGIFPTGASSVNCLSAVFKPSTDMWVVTCTFYSNQGAVVQTSSYTVSDTDGKLVQ
jgi:hypothetical protein